MIRERAAGTLLRRDVGPGDRKRLHLGVMNPRGGQVGQRVQITKARPALFQIGVWSRKSASGQREDTVVAIVARPPRHDTRLFRGATQGFGVTPSQSSWGGRLVRRSAPGP